MKAPFRYSYSKLKDFHRCQKYFEHKHVDGVPDPDMENSADMRFGSAIHLGVQDLFEGGNGLDVFKMWWEMEEANDLKYTRLKHAGLAKLGVELLEIFRDEHMKHFVPLHLEKKLVSRIGEHAYSGVIDNLGTYKRVPSITDWKTSATPYDKYKIEVDEQMYSYAHLAEKELGFKAEQLVYGIAIKDPKNPRWQFRTAPVSQQIVSKKLANVEQVCDAISNTKVFTQNPNQCVTGSYGNVRVCPYYNLCHQKDSNGDGEEG